LLSWNPELPRLATEEQLELLIPAEADAAFRQVKDLFASEKLLDFEPRGMAMGTRVGMQASVWIVRKGVEYQKLITSPAPGKA
jgi:hypothetical protein